MDGDTVKTVTNHAGGLFPDEVPTKMWPLPVSDLFFVGRQTTKRLHALGIFTIGDLAKTDKKVIHDNLKGHGDVIWEFANGIGDSMEDVANKNRKPANKGYSNETTLAFDVTDAALAKEILLSLTETVATRVRADKSKSLERISLFSMEMVPTSTGWPLAWHSFTCRTMARNLPASVL